MSKESPYSSYRPIFRETFSSETETRKQASSITAVTFEKGIASFNGSTSKIKYQNINDGIYSVRIRFYFYNKSGYNWLFSGGGTIASLDIGFSTGSTVRTYAGTTYINGVASSTINSTEGAYNELIVTGIYYTKNKDNFYIGCYNNGNAEFTKSSIELVEIYKGTLTASEVKNLYDNDWNKEFISSNLLLDYDSTNGYITDRTGKNTLTATDVSIKKTGSYYGADFNGTTSNLITDSTDPTIWQSGFTVVAWIKPRGWGELSNGRILDVSNSSAGKDGFNFCINNLNSSLLFNINEAATRPSGINSINIGSWQFVVLTVSSNSSINFYIGDLDNAPALSGIANQKSGLVSGITTTNPLTIGNRSTATDRTFDGKIPMLKVYEGILDLETITQIRSSTKGKVQ